MPRKPQPWFRFYVETMGDRKVRRLTPAERWAWAGVLSAARESPVPGRLFIADGVPMTTDDLADYADVPARTVSSALAKMAQLGMVSTGDEGALTVTNWGHRQFETDDVTIRTRTHRERSKERSIEVPGNVPRNGVGTDVGTPSSRARASETETETDKNKNSRSAKPSKLDRFDEFWTVYPKRVAKAAAERRWEALLRRGVDPQDIITGAKAYAETVRGTEAQFIKQPDGWLNAGRWQDEPTRPSQPQAHPNGWEFGQ